jgi:hypothetical protein
MIMTTITMTTAMIAIAEPIRFSLAPVDGGLGLGSGSGCSGSGVSGRGQCRDAGLRG